MKASSLREISGSLPATIDIIRTVAGLALPVRCTIVQGFSVGSCSYNDVCKDVLQGIAVIATELPVTVIPVPPVTVPAPEN